MILEWICWKKVFEETDTLLTKTRPRSRHGEREREREKGERLTKMGSKAMFVYLR